VLHSDQDVAGMPLEETDNRGRKTRTPKPGTTVRHPARFSHLTLAANLYMAGSCWDGRWLGLEQKLGSRIVTYADDLVILCRRGKAEEALQKLRKIMSKLKLTVNEERHEICRSRKGDSTFWATRSGECILRDRSCRLDIGHRREHQAHGSECP